MTATSATLTTTGATLTATGATLKTVETTLDTARDTSNMKTISLLTTLFLPFTFFAVS
jgi:hypothetical protein